MESAHKRNRGIVYRLSVLQGLGLAAGKEPCIVSKFVYTGHGPDKMISVNNEADGTEEKPSGIEYLECYLWVQVVLEWLHGLFWFFLLFPVVFGAHLLRVNLFRHVTMLSY